MIKKQNSGLSYIELTIAFALFIIMAAATFSTLLQAGRNLELAKSNYIAYRGAESIMLAVRDAVSDGAGRETWVNIAASMAEERDIAYFSVWVFGAREDIPFHSSGVPANTASLPVGDILPTMQGYTSTIIVAVWNVWDDQGNIAGRAIGKTTELPPPILSTVPFFAALKIANRPAESKKTRAKTKGSAYIMVLMATLITSMLLTISLTITATSRRFTEHYQNFANLYDMAVAGNEQVLFLLNHAIIGNLSELSEQSQLLQYESPDLSRRNAFIEATTPVLQAALSEYFGNAQNSHEWIIEINFETESGHHIQDTFIGATEVVENGNNFIVITRISQPAPASVQASIVWETAANHLDYYMLKMVELRRL